MPETPADKNQVKELENKAKAAFKDGDFAEAEKWAGQLKQLDAENRFAEKITEKAKKAKAEATRQKHAVELKSLENEIKTAFRAGSMERVDHLADQIRKIDPENKVVKKMADRVMQAKNKLEEQARKLKLEDLRTQLIGFYKSQKTDEALKKANEVLELKWGEPRAMKILKKIAKEKNVGVETLVTVTPPARPDKKPGFLQRLFGKKKEEGEASKKEKPAQSTPALRTLPARSGSGGQPAKQAPQPAKPEVKKAEEKGTSDQTKNAGFLSRLFKKKDKKEAPAVPTLQPPLPASTPAVRTLQPPLPASTPAVRTLPARSGLGGQSAEPQQPAPATVPQAIRAAVPPPLKKPAPADEVKQPAPPTPASTPAVRTLPAPSGLGGQAAEPKPGAKVDEKGNIFTKLFGKEEGSKAEQKSIIDTIVSKSDEAKKEKEKEEKKKEDSLGAGLLKFSSLLLQFSMAFIVVSAGFFYAQNIDENNTVLSYINIENYASQLKGVADERDTLQDELGDIDEEIQGYVSDVENPRKEVIQRIASDRLDWGDLLSKLNEVTESVYEKNALLGYVKYNNYSYNVETGQLSVSGDLSDPKGRNLTKLAELEQAFNHYPRDPENPQEDVQPYFYGLREFQSFTKSYDAATDRYKTNFSLSLFTRPQDNQ